MARSYTNIRQDTVQQTRLKWTTGTADSGSSTNVLTDAELTRYGDGEFNGYHILITSGSPTYTELFITKFLQADGDALFRPEESADVDSLTYEILPFSGTDILRAVRDAILECYDHGILSRNFWMNVMGGSPLYNADWSYWTSSTAVDGWTATSVSVARERASANLSMGETAVRLHTAAGYLSLDTQWQRFLHDFKGYAVTLYCWVNTAASSNARLALNDGSANTYSAYHGGGGGWELLSVEDVTTNVDTAMQPRLYIDTSSQAYFGIPFVAGGPIVREYPFAHNVMPDGPYEMRASRPNVDASEIATQRGLGTQRHFGHQRFVTDYRVVKHHDENTTTQVGVLDFSSSRRPPREGHLLRLRGDGPLTVPTTVTSSDNIEVTESESILLAKVAARNLLQRGKSGKALSTQRIYDTRISELDLEIFEFSGGAGESRDVATYTIGW